MARLNISIPDELKSSMEGLNCNWSELAQMAFENAVKVEQLKGEGNDVEAGLVRLRASKQANSDREQADGFANGRYWALEEASYDELKEIVTAFDRAQNNAAKYDEALQALKKQITGRHICIPGLNIPAPSNAYVAGYAEGVEDVFHQI